MRLFGIAGWSGSGKTTLLVRLIPALVRRGIAVATVKHSHHGLSLEECGAVPGAVETLTAGPERWALVHGLDGGEPPLAELATRLRGVDLLLVEGFKGSPHPKLEVWAPSTGEAPLAAKDPSVMAVAADAPLPGLSLPRFPRDDVEAIATFILGGPG